METDKCIGVSTHSCSFKAKSNAKDKWDLADVPFNSAWGAGIMKGEAYDESQHSAYREQVSPSIQVLKETMSACWQAANAGGEFMKQRVFATCFPSNHN